MRAVVQRVSEASVVINGEKVAAISKGLLVLLGIEKSDNEEDGIWLSGKIARLRIFPDGYGAMNLPITETEGNIIVVSQFTLHASTRKGNRPSFIRAAKPETALPLYKAFIERLKEDTGKDISTGEFGAMMQVHLVNDGPVTLFIDSKNKE
ncbi:MAG: D-aminoacyl-tRNA deacylase [Lentimicrobiaceae bacterium]|nr:D-aminoacyl-tRNA deacylase [Lentimicrobiaceae bacterium]